METMSLSWARPSMYLMCRLASIVQKFKTRLQEKVSQRKRALNSFGASYYRGIRLRALSDLEKVQIPRRRQTLTKDPKADLHHEEHASFVNDLLHDLDEHTRSKALPLTKVAADDNLLFCQSHGALVETLTEHMSLQHVAYAFDLSTFLINRLDQISSDCGRASQSWKTYNAECNRLKDEKYIANLLHLLRCLQYFLFQILVHRSLKRLDDLHDDWKRQDSRQEGKSLDADWFSEWPSGERPLSTTWPWNIRPSLVVLWGVCWMFYPSEQGNNDNSYRVPAQHILDSSGFMESWAPNSFSQTDLDEAANIHLTDGSMITYSQAPGDARLLAQAPSNYGEANPGRRSSPPAAPHLDLRDSLATPHFTPPSLVGINTSHPPPLRGLGAPNARLHVNQNAYNYSDPAFAGASVSRDPWVPVTSGGNITYAFSGHDNTNAFTPTGYHTPISQAQSFFPQQTTSADLPTLEVSPINGPNYSPNIDTPTSARIFSGPRRAIFSNFIPPNMGVSDAYPISPQSERRRSTSIPTSASPINSLITSPVMSTSQSPQNSESSTRQRVSVQRTHEPPRNDKNEIYCSHQECEPDPPTFRRRCEWNKHMDKHERPYKCAEPGCEKLQGFTYSGGLLRHQREVHKKNGTAKATLFCPYPNCNRHTGQGFTRKENLNEHIRRRHVAQPGLAGQQSPPTAAVSKVGIVPSNYEAGSSRKRKRTTDSVVEAHDDDEEDEEEDDDDADDANFDDSGLADTEEREEANKRIKVEVEEHDPHVRENRRLKDENALLHLTLRETQVKLQEKIRALVESQQTILELQRRLGINSGRLMTAPQA